MTEKQARGAEWQPIDPPTDFEGAPWRGERVLLTDGDWIWIDNIIVRNGERFWEIGADAHWYPTHWMNLPEPPAHE